MPLTNWITMFGALKGAAAKMYCRNGAGNLCVCVNDVCGSAAAAARQKGGDKKVSAVRSKLKGVENSHHNFFIISEHSLVTRITTILAMMIRELTIGDNMTNADTTITTSMAQIVVCD